MCVFGGETRGILSTKCRCACLPCEIQANLVKIDNPVKETVPYDTIISKTGARKEKSHLLNHRAVQDYIALNLWNKLFASPQSLQAQLK